jgi:hypothetical protein
MAQEVNLAPSYRKIERDNVIRAIYDELKKVFGNPEKHSKRIFWELLQNAADTAEGKAVNVEFELNDREFIFRHDGMPFNADEMAHLRLYGTTKLKAERKIGRFGKGFMTTHVIAKKVVVRGQYRDQPGFFEFVIDREGDKREELEAKIGEVLENPIILLQQEPNVKEGFTTEYVYPLKDGRANVPSEAVLKFKKFVPFVLAFEKKINSVTILEFGEKSTWSRLGEKELEIGKLVTIKCPLDELVKFVIISDEEVQIAFEVKESEAGFNIMDLGETPRLFISFPLFGTEKFPFPVVVNSSSFCPLEDRDGIDLGTGNTPDIEWNKQLLERARKLYFKLLSFAESENWENLHFLVKLPGFSVRTDITDVKWLKEFCGKLIEFCCKKRVLQTSDGGRCAPFHAYVPASDDIELGCWIWRCAKPLYASNIPSEHTIKSWIEIVASWKELSSILPMDLTVSKLADKVAQIGSIRQLQLKTEELSEKSKLYDWLRDFLKLVKEHGRELFDVKPLLPNQRGEFKVKLGLDPGICEELKDCAEGLGWDLRSELLDPEVSSIVGDLLPERVQDQVVIELIRRAKERAKDKELDEVVVSSIFTLFKWLVKNGYLHEIKDDFPFVNRRYDRGEREGIISYSQPGKELLSPCDIWPQEARKNIISDEFILSSRYVNFINLEEWKLLEGLLRREPLYIQKTKLSKPDLEYMTSEDLDKEHRTTEEVEISRIAFLEEEDKGIYYQTRTSRDRAREFLRFLFDYVIKIDDKWKEEKIVSCECGKNHKICPARWLGYLRNTKWVPTKTKGRDRPSPETLAWLFEDDRDLQEKLHDRTVLEFLTALGTSATDIYVFGKGKERAIDIQQPLMSILIRAGENPKEQLQKLADFMSEPNFIEEAEKWIQVSRRVRDNRTVGEYVEDLLMELLKSSSKKYELRKIQRGADIEVEYDNIENGQELVYEIGNILIEVKTTRKNEIEMTPRQAETAVDRGNRFILCVVEIPEGTEISKQVVKENSRFVDGLGFKLQEWVRQVQEQSESLNRLSSKTGEIGVRIKGFELRYAISKTLWESKMGFEEFKKYLECMPLA